MMRCKECGHEFYLKEGMHQGRYIPRCPKCYSAKLENLMTIEQSVEEGLKMVLLTRE